MEQGQEGGSMCVCMEQGQEGGSMCVCMEQGQEGWSSIVTSGVIVPTFEWWCHVVVVSASAHTKFC